MDLITRRLPTLFYYDGFNYPLVATLIYTMDLITRSSFLVRFLYMVDQKVNGFSTHQIIL